ncbi:MAG: ring-opening amidohydrolase [Azospirillum sp.]|nr:ring-opening amidohydrolase [Azospirillum sp.]MCA3265099.1 ring-opening amidohydrolase [Azospirillum sp.]MCZ8125115.1 ring-opening amidohydrolase [Magnetospirillum sp.]
MRAIVRRFPMRGPDDCAALRAAFADGSLDPKRIVAILGKTEGNGCVNDFTRGYATLAMKIAIAEATGETPADVGARVALVMSGGTEGGLSPHMTVFATAEDDARPRAGVKRLAMGVGFTRDFAAHEVGRRAQIEATAQAVRAAMADAGIDSAADVHYVQVKCPLLTAERIAGADVVTHDTYESMGYSRGASALGVALALGEIAACPPDAAVCADWSLSSGVASTSAGIELLRNEVMVLGNSDRWSGDLAISHRVMKDGIDAPALWGALADLGIEGRHQLDAAARARIAAVLAKAEPPRTGLIRGARHIMWDDSDINATRHARALVGGALAGIVGETRLFVSGGAEHQGPDGGGPVAAIARQ